MRARVRFAPLLVLSLLAFASSGQAQISPGELSLPHAALEGSANCLGCHDAGKGVDRAQCLACHRALAERVSSGAGLHAGEPYQRCERCHPEHNGRRFELVHWTDGEKGLDHALAGWPLEGKHANLACPECHRADRVSARVQELEPKKDPARTYLGLSPVCASCHADPHRGSMRGSNPAAGCADCHSQESWRSARSFDHSRTHFALDAVHTRVACASCHKQPSKAAPDSPAVLFDQFRARTSPPACADCHRDPHEGRLGGDCARCHAGSTFKQAEPRAVDHERTAYPLRGRHREVACERCHQPGRDLRISRSAPLDRCESCHRDPHFGQLARLGAAGGASAAREGRCDTCHSVEGWMPARFGLVEHGESRFPLEGAHRAVPCSTCHVEVAAAELPDPFRQPRAERVRSFRSASVDCAGCHRDPHAGELEHWNPKDGCRACHDQEGWKPARFDHARTRFALDGAHGRAACDACHARTAVTPSERRFTGRPLDCAGCHRDVHEGQLALAGSTDCARCHSVERFRPAPGFDHARTRFPLDGKHAGVACARCHPAEKSAAGEIVRYTGRPLDCAGCHAGGPAPKTGGAPS